MLRNSVVVGGVRREWGGEWSWDIYTEPKERGWGVTYDVATHMLSINVEAVIGAAVAAAGLSGAIFARWGEVVAGILSASIKKGHGFFRDP